MRAVIPPLLLLFTTSFASAEGETVREKSLALILEQPQPTDRSPPKILPKPKSPELEIKSMDEAEAILTMPEFKVEAKPLDPIEIKLNRMAHIFAEIERAQKAELAKTEPTVLDEILNHPLLSIFGGETAEARAAKARARIENMDLERMLLFGLAQATNEKDKQEIQSIIVTLREMRRRM